LQRTSNPVTAVAYGFSQSWEWSKLIAISFVRLVQGEVSARNIGGVLTIGRVASKSFEVGLVAFLKMMAIISINLFLLNLLPVPVLDGGHLVFFSLEAIKGAPISFRKLEIAQQVGLVLLMSLMIFALFNDITNLISSW
jgi:regulator of sigma E protease